MSNLLLRKLSLLAMMSVCAVFLVQHASAATITVNNADDNAADDGNRTLREAIASANADTASGADGGEFDDDDTANGVIVDPVGLATTASLANTGENIWLYGAGILSVLGVGVHLGFRRSNLGARF